MVRNIRFISKISNIKASPTLPTLYPSIQTSTNNPLIKNKSIGKNIKTARMTLSYNKHSDPVYNFIYIL